MRRLVGWLLDRVCARFEDAWDVDWSDLGDDDE